jgi:TolA-binding protein
MVRRGSAHSLVLLALLAACTDQQHRGGQAAAPAPIAAAPQSAVSGKVAEFRAESDRLSAKVTEDRQALDDLRARRTQLSGIYFDQVSTINARLQAGTTPGNPELMATWQQAQGALTGLDESVTKLSDLGARLSSDSAEAGYLANSVRAAFSLEGALETDHAQLADIQSQASSNQVVLDRLLADVADDVNRQTDALAVEHRNLPTLLHAIEVGELLGGSLSNASGGHERAAPAVEPEPLPAAAPPTEPAPEPEIAAAPPPPKPSKPTPQLVVVATQSPAEYEPALYKVAAASLQRSRTASVEVVAVLPSQGPPTARALATEAARHKAEAVARALVSFGVARDHVSTSATQGSELSTGEVWVYTQE